jgi:hypothetical protein
MIDPMSNPTHAQRIDMITMHAWEAWTQNGLYLDEEEKYQIERVVRDVVKSIYYDGIDDLKWLDMTVRRLRSGGHSTVPILWLSEDRGIYIPCAFANSFSDRAKSVSGVSAEDWQILENGPDSEYYWDVWADVCANAIVTDNTGNKYSVYMDGNCWIVPVEQPND